MINGLYVCKDEKVGFLQVMQDSNDSAAIRNFGYACTRSDSLHSVYRVDFALYKVGSFDTDTGKVILEPSLKLLARGSDFGGEFNE